MFDSLLKIDPLHSDDGSVVTSSRVISFGSADSAHLVADELPQDLSLMIGNNGSGHRHIIIPGSNGLQAIAVWSDEESAWHIFRVTIENITVRVVAKSESYITMGRSLLILDEEPQEKWTAIIKLHFVVSDVTYQLTVCDRRYMDHIGVLVTEPGQPSGEYPVFRPK